MGRRAGLAQQGQCWRCCATAWPICTHLSHSTAWHSTALDTHATDRQLVAAPRRGGQRVHSNCSQVAHPLKLLLEGILTAATGLRQRLGSTRQQQQQPAKCIMCVEKSNWRVALALQPPVDIRQQAACFSLCSGSRPIQQALSASTPPRDTGTKRKALHCRLWYSMLPHLDEGVLPNP